MSEIGRFWWWLNHAENAPAITQAFSAIIVMVFTLVLCGITIWSTWLARHMTRAALAQLYMDLYPHIDIEVEQEQPGSKLCFANICNRGKLPLRLRHARMHGVAEDPDGSSIDIGSAILPNHALGGLLLPEKSRKLRFSFANSGFDLSSTAKKKFTAHYYFFSEWTDIQQLSSHHFVYHSRGKIVEQLTETRRWPIRLLSRFQRWRVERELAAMITRKKQR